MSAIVHPYHQAISEFDSIDSDKHSFIGGAVGNKLSDGAAVVMDGQEVPLDKRVEAYRD